MTKQSFEKSLKDLEQIVQDLETGDLPLEKAIKKFEEGIQLSRSCSKLLDETEKRIALLIKNPDGAVQETAFIQGTD